MFTIHVGTDRDRPGASPARLGSASFLVDEPEAVARAEASYQRSLDVALTEAETLRWITDMIGAPV